MPSGHWLEKYKVDVVEGGCERSRGSTGMYVQIHYNKRGVADCGYEKSLRVEVVDDGCVVVEAS